jgi:hypothetical protein
MPLRDQDELALTDRLAREMTNLGLEKQVALLREYYQDVLAGRASEAWSHEQSVQWLKVLRLPPHEYDYPVLPRMSSCPNCPPGEAQVYTCRVSRVAHVGACACGARWVEAG